MPSLPPLPSRLTGETRGILGMIVALLFLATMDSFAKALSTHLPTAQIVWARYTGQTLIIAAICLPRLRATLATRNLGLQLGRSALLFIVTALYFYALGFMKFAEAAALLQTAPLLITMLAALVLGEPVGPRRWAGVCVGLIGAMILIHPGVGVFQPAALLLMVAALAYAFYQIATRWLGGADGLWTTLLYTTGFGAVLSSLALPFVWVTPDPQVALMMAGMAGAGCLGHLCLVWALGQAPTSVLAPFNYAGLLWATLIGLVVFGEAPDALTLTGAAIIVAAGLYVWHRERIRQGTPPALERP